MEEKDEKELLQEIEEYNKKILPKQIDGEDGRWLWSKEKFEIDMGDLI